ncbi:glycine oxidase ThiO [Paenibacillus septentrionalis]|uniref:glycine oxidase n=1 Tax=Paenibacillus septentrionalis TaxID=429342 RepID=A0ABW1V224_9BACL
MNNTIMVIGGGVIGLSCAFELRQRGFEVVVLEQHKCGGQASGAAAGMLAPYSENVEGPDEFFQLCLYSLQLYANWQEEVKRISGMSFEYTSSGSLYVVQHDADLLVLEGRLHWQRKYGSTGRIIEGDELFQLEPLLSRQVRAALYTPEECHLYAPDYVLALEQACRNLGVRIYEHVGQVELLEWNNEVTVRAADGRIFGGDQLLVCSGAWAQQTTEVLGMSVPIYPIRGQICAYDRKAHPVNHMVFSSQGYVVGKENGSLVCGASEDVAGFDTNVTEQGIERLKRWNKHIFPALDGMKPFHSWAGLRPSTQDGMPLIGRLSGEKSRILLAAGHYRNGILLSPATAKLISDIAEQKDVAAYNIAFSPERFSLAQSH